MLDTLTLAAAGDISFKHVSRERLAEQGPRHPFEHVIPVLEEADLRFANQESVLIPDDFPADKLNPRALQSGDFTAPALAEAGFDVMHMATNHVLDCGTAGLDHTFRTLKRQGITPLGAGPDATESAALRVFERNGVGIGFLGYLEPANWTLEGCADRVNYFSLDKALADIARYRTEVDVLAVSLHAGLEFCDVPSRPRRDACRAMAEAGARLILCHHAHVPQGTERHAGCLIAYGLGNFHFPVDGYLKNASAEVYRNHVLMMEIGKNGVERWERRHFRIKEDADGRPCPLTPEERAEAATHFARLDALLTDEREYAAVWHARCMEYMDAYWNWMTERGAAGFTEGFGWRVLALPENLNWTAGIREMARERYGAVKDAAFEFDRPNAQFEQDGRIF